MTEPGTPRERGNALYKEGDFPGAAAAYTAGINQLLGKAELRGDAAAELATLLSNRAECFLQLSDHDAAAADCRQALALQPCAWKAYHRLARALPPEHVDAAPAVCAAIALLLPTQPPSALLELYDQIRSAHAACAANTNEPGARGRPTGLQLPALGVSATPDQIARAVACVPDVLHLATALAKDTPVIVLKPGVYNLHSSAMLQYTMAGAKQYTLVGVGTVELRNLHSHAVFVQQGCVQLVGVRLVGNGHQAAACVAGDPMAALGSSGRPILRMIQCCVEDYGDVAALAVGADLELVGCTFKRTGKQAVEVCMVTVLLCHRVS